MQVKKAELYDRILMTAEKLFIRYGYAKTSLKLIAKIQIFALTDVITSYENPEELKKHILLLMKYHYVGLNGLLPKEKR